MAYIPVRINATTTSNIIMLGLLRRPRDIKIRYFLYNHDISKEKKNNNDNNNLRFH